MSKKSEEAFTKKIIAAEQRVAVGGRYRHAKTDGEYTVTDLAILESTEEVGVVYQAEYGNRLKWIRSVHNFLEEIELNGKKTPRFVQISTTNREVTGKAQTHGKPAGTIVKMSCCKTGITKRQ